MKIIVFKGGIGNQLFQLCLYLELLKGKHNEKVLIDNKTGFLLDFRFKRKFEFTKAISRKKLIKNFLILLNLFLILGNKYFSIKILEKIKVYFISDKDFKLKKTSKDFVKHNNYCLYNGYFQNYKLVERNISELLKYIEPYLLKKVNNNFENLYKRILSEKNSVALSIRFFEENKNTAPKNPREKSLTVSQVNKVIKDIEKKLNNPHFFIFVTYQNEFIEKLEINSESTLVLYENGFDWERLRAQSYCRHHIFNNSTFNWWGAILSHYWNNNLDQIVYVSDNFFWKETYNPSWEIFNA